MIHEIDKSTMIESLTDGIGAKLGRACRLSFYSQFDRLIKKKTYSKLTIEEQQTIVDLLAISSFYHTIIVPLESSKSLFSILEQSQASHIRLSSSKLDIKFAGKCYYASTGFEKILEKAKIPKSLLAYATLNDFIEKVLTHFSKVKM